MYPPPNSQILQWFRRELSFHRYSEKPLRIGTDASSLSKDVSSLRRILLPLCKGDSLRRIENILHALRALLALHERYELLSKERNQKMPNLMGLALSFSAAESIAQFESILRVNFPLLAIPGIILCLSPSLSSSLNSVSIELVLPDFQNELSEILPQKVRSPALFPKRFFARNKPFSVTLAILCHNEKYLGYAYIFTKSGIPVLNDDLQEVLSQNLYRLYLKEGKTKSRPLMVANREELTERIPLSQPEQGTRQGKISVEGIMDYLLDHIDEMCDLEKMADYFGMSKSYITRRTKELTGFSTQTLHERLKIEQAKNLIKNGNLRMNDIAQQLGFSNPNYFSNVFKKVTGLRPTEFAEEVTNSQR